MTTNPTPPTGLEPTQTRRPWRTTFRTVVQVGIPAIFLLPTLIQYAIEELGPHLPPAATAWLIAAGVVVTAVAGLIARIMAIPTVEVWLRKVLGGALAAQPQPKPDDQARAAKDTSWGASTVELALIVIAVVVVVAFVLWVAR